MLQDGGCFLCLYSKPPMGETPLALGLLLLPGQQRTGPGPVAAVERAQEEEIKGSHVGPAFISRSKRCKQTLSLCQAAAAPSSRPQTALPSLLLTSSRKPAALSAPGAPQRGLLLLKQERGGSQTEGRRGLGPSHLDVFPPSDPAGSWRLTHQCPLISTEPSSPNM